MFENLSQEQFEHILDILILYKQINPTKNVYLNEKCTKDAIQFMNTTGKQFASKLGMNKDEDDNDN
jgi:hypothetical protein